MDFGVDFRRRGAPGGEECAVQFLKDCAGISSPKHVVLTQPVIQQPAGSPVGPMDEYGGLLVQPVQVGPTEVVQKLWIRGLYDERWGEPNWSRTYPKCCRAWGKLYVMGGAPLSNVLANPACGHYKRH